LFIHDFDLLRWLSGQEIVESDGFMAKNILPEYPDFYDTANLSVMLDGNILAQLYADWHNPEKSWTWGGLSDLCNGYERNGGIADRFVIDIDKQRVRFQVAAMKSVPPEHL
jgi:predicted dehydrogenase